MAASPYQFQVYASSGVPIYRQLMDQVRQQVSAGRLSPGDFLPSVRSIAQALAVNPMTVSKAYSLLEREGVVDLVRGQGMRIAAHAGNPLPLRHRQAQLLPLLEQAVATAYQLSLTPQQVRAMLDSLLKELPSDKR